MKPTVIHEWRSNPLNVRVIEYDTVDLALRPVRGNRVEYQLEDCDDAPWEPLRKSASALVADEIARLAADRDRLRRALEAADNLRNELLSGEMEPAVLDRLTDYDAARAALEQSS